MKEKEAKKIRGKDNQVQKTEGGRGREKQIERQRERILGKNVKERKAKTSRNGENQTEKALCSYSITPRLVVRRYARQYINGHGPLLCINVAGTMLILIPLFLCLLGDEGYSCWASNCNEVTRHYVALFSSVCYFVLQFKFKSLFDLSCYSLLSGKVD